MTAGPSQGVAPALTPTRKSTQAVIGAAIVVLITLVALVGSPRIAQRPADAGNIVATGKTTTVSVSVDGMSFIPSRILVPAGNVLKVEFHNTGDQTHDLVLANGSGTPRVAAGASSTLDAGVITSSLAGWCSLPGHRAMGMTLDVIVVTGGIAGPDPGHDMGETVGTGDGDKAAPGPTMAQLMTQAEASPASSSELTPLTDVHNHEYTFTVTESTDPVTPGLTRALWTYNGTSPGPTLHGAVGDTFTITLVNNGTLGHSIDFHAGDLSPDAPMRTIDPGQTLVYKFTAKRAGIWMYHCSTMPMSQHIANGMFGAVVIEPNGLAPVEASYLLVQSELYLGSDGQPASTAKAAGMAPDVVMFNGRAFQYSAHPLTAKVGDRVRLWVLDAGPNVSLAFHVVGKQFDTVWTEGAYSIKAGTGSVGNHDATGGAQVLPLLASQAGFVEFTVNEPGRYAFVNHQMSLAEKGAKGVLEVTAP